MFVKNWYKMQYFCAANATLLQSAMVYANGSTATSNTQMGNLWYCGTRFGVVSTSYSSPCMTRPHSGDPRTENSWGGVFFGDGSTPPTMDDYMLSGNPISGITVSSSSLNKTFDDTGISLSATYTIVNNNANEITIAEIGLFEAQTNSGMIMMERTVLDSPVTIPAGGVGQVTYTIRMVYPTD